MAGFPFFASAGDYPKVAEVRKSKKNKKFRALPFTSQEA
jgi:hypothetical protein